LSEQDRVGKIRLLRCQKNRLSLFWIFGYPFYKPISAKCLIQLIKMSGFDYDKIQLRKCACTWQCGAHNLGMNKPIQIELQ